MIVTGTPQGRCPYTGHVTASGSPPASETRSSLGPELIAKQDESVPPAAPATTRCPGYGSSPPTAKRHLLPLVPLTFSSIVQHGGFENGGDLQGGHGR